MSFIAAAVIGGSSIIGGLLSSNAAGDAASAQEQAANQAAQIQQQEFNTVQSEYGPQRNLGYGADTLLAQLFGIANPISATGYYSTTPGVGQAPTSGSATPAAASSGILPAWLGGTPKSAIVAPATTPSGAAPSISYLAPGGAASSNFSNFYNTPGYKFTLNQGVQALQRQAAANGNLYSTNTLNQLGTYAEGVASNQYNNYVQQLLSLAGLGGSATAGTASAGTSAANNESQAALIAGSANASGILGQTNAITGAVNSLTNPNSAFMSAIMNGINGGGGGGSGGGPG